MSTNRWTENDRAQLGEILMLLDWVDPEGDPKAVIVDRGIAAGHQRYRATLFAGPVIAEGSDLAAVQYEVERQIPAAA